jgi:hypothetical protein
MGWHNGWTWWTNVWHDGSIQWVDTMGEHDWQMFKTMGWYNGLTQQRNVWQNASIRCVDITDKCLTWWKYSPNTKKIQSKYLWYCTVHTIHTLRCSFQHSHWQKSTRKQIFFLNKHAHNFFSPRPNEWLQNFLERRESV